MKRVILLIAVIGMFAISCEKEEVKSVRTIAPAEYVTKTAPIVYTGNEGQFVSKAYADSSMAVWAANPVNSGALGSFTIENEILDILNNYGNSVGVHLEYSVDSNSDNILHYCSSNQFGEHFTAYYSGVEDRFYDIKNWKTTANRDTSVTGVFIGKEILNYHINTGQDIEFHYGQLLNGSQTLFVKAVGDSLYSMPDACSHGISLFTCPFHVQQPEPVNDCPCCSYIYPDYCDCEEECYLQ